MLQANYVKASIKEEDEYVTLERRIVLIFFITNSSSILKEQF